MKSCGILGHRDFNDASKVVEIIQDLEDLIVRFNIEVFNLGTNSDFTEMCLNDLLVLKNKHPHIKIVIFPIVYSKDLLRDNGGCFDAIHFEKDFASGKKSYIIRDQSLIDNSNLIYCYYNKGNAVNRYNQVTKSGTAIAYEYAKKKNKIIFNLAENN